jgi:hypothetical protein
MNDYIWKSYHVNEEDYNSLTKQIWISAFQNKEILTPLEELDSRIYLVKSQLFIKGQKI